MTATGMLGGGRLRGDAARPGSVGKSVVGDPFTEALVGPCSGAWGRAPGEYGKVAYFISDGGTASPAPGGPLPAKLQRVEF